MIDDMKKCSSCKNAKHVSEFHKRKASKDGLSPVCISCDKIRMSEYRRTKTGVIKEIYRGQKRNSKDRGYDEPSYTLKELTLFIFNQNNFDEIYKLWVDSGYDKNLTPSVDRIDDYKNYSLDNIQLMTWKENAKKSYDDRKNGINNKLNKAVNQLTIDSEFILNYHSISEASRALNISQSNINACCLNKRETAGGFKWEYSEG